MRQLWLLLLTTTEQNNDIISVTFFYLFIDINILLKSSLPTVYRWWNMVLANRWLRVEHCCTAMSYDALGHFLIFIWLLGPLAFFNRTNIIQMIFSMSWELYILCIILKTTAFFRCCLFLWFFYLILEVFRLCGISCFHLNTTIILEIYMWYIFITNSYLFTSLTPWL